MMFLFVFTTMPVMMFNVVFNVQIQVIQLIQVGKIVVCGFALALALFFALIFCPPNFALSDEHDFEFALCCAL